jgi:hypothetical protein
MKILKIKMPKIKLPKLTTIQLAIMMGSIVLLSFAFVQYQSNNRKLDIQERQNSEEKLAESDRKFSLSLCLIDANDVYWDYIKLNNTSAKENNDGTITYQAYQSDWTEAQKRKDKAVELCELKYGK